MYRSPTLGAGDIDYLYSELACGRFGEHVDETSGQHMRAALHHLLRKSARTGESDAALTLRRCKTRTYAELWDTVARLAVGLKELGIEKDDRVAVFLEKRLETVEAIFGTSAAGGVFVPINPLLEASAGRIHSSTTAAFGSS